MAECVTCKHSNVLHNDNGTCSVPGCACDQLIVPEIAPDVQPPKPGACLHLIQDGVIWTIEELDEVEEKLDEVSEGFCKFTVCDFEKVEGQPRQKYTTYRHNVRPQAITSYHEMTQERWDRILDAT